MPDYTITIYLKNGKIREGIRWHPSYDARQVRDLVYQKLKNTVGLDNVDFVRVEPTAMTPRGQMKTKPLTP